MDAFFFIDKPTGITSFQLLREMKKFLGIKKIGHSWTLDPLATWGMLVATWWYTKLISYVEKDSKSYIADIMLDGTSPSYDSDTDVEFLSEEKQKKARSKITQDLLESIFTEKFSGKITQVPPKYSALKIQWKRALDRTLAGEEVVMKEREAHILLYKILSYSYPKLQIEISVSAGTYIRSIAHDLWVILWTWGYLSALRRTKVGNIDISCAQKLEDLDATKYLDMKQIFPKRVFEFSDETVLQRLSDGQRVRGEYDFPENENIFLMKENMVLYVVEYKEWVLHPRKKIV